MNSKGIESERLAADYLQQQGLILLSSNYSCRFGEIDLVMREGKTLVFVEVRQRSTNQFGGAAMSITHAKQKKISLTAQSYLQKHGDSACRFDVVLIDGKRHIEWVRNAFEAAA